MDASMLLILCLVCILQLQKSGALQVRNYPLLMPNARVDRDELYLCTAVKVVPKQIYIVGFERNITMDTVHHMSVFGCSVPGTNEPYWYCGEMSISQSNNNLKKARPCAEGVNLLYAWSRRADALELPEDVGFKIGLNTEISYLVLQIHYSRKYTDGKTDNSGILLKCTEEPRSKLAGVLLLGTIGSIPPHSVTNMEVSCKIDENKVIHPFAYSIHTHNLGKVVAGYKVRRNENGVDQWTLLGKRDPLTPQTFYPVFDKSPIYEDDVLAARCTMESNRDRVTYIGPTYRNEMCNFYLMYYVDGDMPLETQMCISLGPPEFHWSDAETDLNNISDKETSLL